MINKITLFTFALIVITAKIFAQSNEVKIGTGFGGGVLGNGLFQTTVYGIATDISTSPEIFQGFIIDAGFFFYDDINALIPGNTSQSYYPHCYGAKLEFGTMQQIQKYFQLYYAGGVTFIKNKTYSDINANTVGLMITAEICLREENVSSKNELIPSIAITTGTTFYKNAISFFVVNLRLSYILNF